MKTVLSFFVTTLVAGNAFAQTSFELTCRSKAKEIAIQTYSSCVTEAKQARVSKIRTSYQKDLANLKSKYDKELKQLSGPTAKTKEAVSSPAPMGLAESLPSKPTDAPIPVQSISDATKVLPADTDETSNSDEEIEFVEMPTE